MQTAVGGGGSEKNINFYKTSLNHTSHTCLSCQPIFSWQSQVRLFTIDELSTYAVCGLLANDLYENELKYSKIQLKATHSLVVCYIVWLYTHEENYFFY